MQICKSANLQMCKFLKSKAPADSGGFRYYYEEALHICTSANAHSKLEAPANNSGFGYYYKEALHICIFANVHINQIA